MDHALKSLESFEIPFVIQKASLFGGTVAQSSMQNPRPIPIKNIDIDTYGTMFIKIFDEEPLEKGRPLSIRLKYRNISFVIDSNEYTIEGDTLVSTLPKRAKALTLRDSERFVLPLNSDVQASCRRIEKRGGCSSFDAQILDVSRSGLAIVVPSPEEQLLLKNDHIWIRSLNGEKLSGPLFARVIYVFERKFINTVDLKVGLSLEGRVPENILSDLQKICRLVLKGLRAFIIPP